MHLAHISRVRQNPRYCAVVRTTRHVSEHFAFAGAAMDTLATLVQGPREWIVLVIVGKGAFMVGALATYLLHMEEHMLPITRDISDSTNTQSVA